MVFLWFSYGFSMVFLAPQPLRDCPPLEGRGAEANSTAVAMLSCCDQKPRSSIHLQGGFQGKSSPDEAANKRGQIEVFGHKTTAIYGKTIGKPQKNGGFSKDLFFGFSLW